MGAVTDPLWLLVLQAEDRPLDISSLPTERREREDAYDAMQRVLGQQDFIEKLTYYGENIAEIEADDKLQLYKIGDGQRKHPTQLTVENAERRFDVNIRQVFNP